MENRNIDFKKERIKYENNNKRNRNYQRNLVLSASCYAHLVFIQCRFFGLYVHCVVSRILINKVYSQPPNLKQSSDEDCFCLFNYSMSLRSLCNFFGARPHWNFYQVLIAGWLQTEQVRGNCNLSKMAEYVRVLSCTRKALPDAPEQKAVQDVHSGCICTVRPEPLS